MRSLGGAAFLVLAASGCSTREAPSTADASTGAIARSVLEVSLAGRADHSLAVRDVRTGVGVRVRLIGAAPVASKIESGAVRFAKGYEGRFDVLQQLKKDAVEDFVRFDARPHKTEVAYELELNDAVAGLRLVENVLELIGADGAPRVRMESPWIESDRDHLRVPVNVAVEGCAVDRDPTVPWTRTPTNPGARHCLARLSWGSEVAYPATLDPSWSTTVLTMAVARTSHSATRLPSGDVLVLGGCQTNGSPNIINSSAEIYGATSGVFATTVSMIKQRAYHTATALLDGRVLVTGGIQGGGSGCRGGIGNFDAELLIDGKVWAPIPMSTARAWHAATLLRDGRVLVAGGHDGAESAPRSTAELFDPATQTFKATTNTMLAPRYAFGVGLLRDGRALAVGGAGGGGSKVDYFDPTTATWSAAPALAAAVSSNRVATMTSGKVLTVGGFGSSYVGEFDPVTNVWSARPALSANRWEIELVPLPTGGMLAIGGNGGSGGTSTVDLFPDVSGRLTHPPTNLGRTWHAAAGVGAPLNRVLVTGGNELSGTPSNTAEITNVGVTAGGTCTADTDCAFNLRCIATKCQTYVPEAGIVYADTGSDVADTSVADTSTAIDSSVADTAVASDAGTVPPVDPKEKPVLAGPATACSGDTECASGFCVDGVCCDSACADRCHTCVHPAAPGKCMLQPVGYDMRGECEAERPCYSTCGPSGACIPSFAGARCAEQRCTGPAAGKGPAVCSGERGSCLRNDSIDFDCTPYSCEPAFGACNSQCSKSDQCAPGHTCDVATAKCVAAPASDDDSGCAIGSPGRVTSFAWLGVAVGLMLAGRRRKQR